VAEYNRLSRASRTNQVTAFEYLYQTIQFYLIRPRNPDIVLDASESGLAVENHGMLAPFELKPRGVKRVSLMEVTPRHQIDRPAVLTCF
jgi:hypothetical protein